MDNKIRQKKSLGQVFLKVDWPSKLIIETLKFLGVSRVLEIGPGAGALTKHLASEGFDLSCVEKDHRYATFLEGFYADSVPSFRIFNEDILDFDFTQWLDPQIPSAVVGNIPYYLSTDILLRALRFLPPLRAVIFLTQLEFAERIVGKPGTKAYGSLSVYAQLRSQPRILEKVPRRLFKPVPKVDSALLCFEPRDTVWPDAILLATEKIVRQVFTQRRKKLSNSLKPFLSQSHSAELPVDLNLRPENLSPEDFIRLTRAIRGI